MNRGDDPPLNRRSSSILNRRRSSQRPKSLTGARDFQIGCDFGEDVTPEERLATTQSNCFKVASDLIAVEFSNGVKDLHHQLIVRGNVASEEFNSELQQSGINPHITPVTNVYDQIKAYTERLNNEKKQWTDILSFEKQTFESHKKKLNNHLHTSMYYPLSKEESSEIDSRFNCSKINETLQNYFLDIEIQLKFLELRLKQIEKLQEKVKKRNSEKFQKLEKLAMFEN